MSAVCPALYRDEQGRFICSYSGREVDPVFMPCLSNYSECPIYVSRGVVTEERAEEAEAAAEVAKEEAAEEAAMEEAAVEAIPVAEEIRGAEEEVLDRLAEIMKEIDKVDSYWSAYESSATRVLKEWSELREEALRILASVDSTIRVHKEELQELEVKKELGLIDEEFYEKATASINERLRRYEALKNRIVEMLDAIESRSTPHYQRLKITTAKPDIGRLKLSLMKLEELYNSGKIDRAVYEKIKGEVEAEIKRLERLLG